MNPVPYLEEEEVSDHIVLITYLQSCLGLLYFSRLNLSN